MQDNVLCGILITLFLFKYSHTGYDRIMRDVFRGVAQMVEHYIRDVGAACSNHVTPTKK